MNLFYRSKGSGIPLVILHGLYGSSDNWNQIAKMLPADYWVISVDLRNHGASPHSTTHTYDEMVTDLAWLFHELEIERAHLLGHSMGGKVAIAFAADYPEKILSLTVADIAPRNYFITPASAIQYDFHKRTLKVLSEIDLSKHHTRTDVEKELKQEIPEKLVRQFILKNLHRTKNQLEWKINVPVLKKQLEHIISGVDANDYSDRIPINQYPVLFIRGSLSGYIQKEDVEIIHKMYPEAKLETIEDATHFLHAEKPGEFVEKLVNFLKTVHN
ncbi:MAG: alpha/beta fold hydrolase [Prolixibacteraceae bacterium]